MTRIIALGTAALLLGSAAQAATYTFDFTQQTTGWSPSVSVTSGDLTLTARGATFTDDADGLPLATGHARVASWTGYGLGVCSSYERRRCRDSSHEIDGDRGNDLAWFDISGDKAYEIVSIVFNLVDRNDDFDFFLDAGAGLSRLLSNTDIPGSGVFTFASPVVVTSLFGIGADGGDDNFKIQSVTLRDTVAPIPLPATGLLLLGALGGLAAVRRRMA